MKWIIITTPTFISHEAKYIDQLFEAGIDLLHLRKPDSTSEECEQLLQKIDPKWYPQIVIHDHFELCEKYHLHGIHLNRRNSQIPENFQGSLSRSCHSFKEVSESVDNANPVFSSADNASPDFPKGSKPKFDYVFLSPIFDSISKKGYKHSFSNRDLEDAGNSGIINEKVIALGGVIPPFIPQLRAWNFGGVAFLGDVWNRRHEYNWKEYLADIKQRLTHIAAAFGNYSAPL